MDLSELKSRCQQAVFRLESQGRIGFLAFPASRGSQHSLVRTHSPIFKASQVRPSSCHATISLVLCFPSLFYILKAICDCIAPDKSRIISKILSQMISNFNSICKLNSLLPWSLPYSQVPGIRTQTSLVDHYH